MNKEEHADFEKRFVGKYVVSFGGDDIEKIISVDNKNTNLYLQNIITKKKREYHICSSYCDACLSSIKDKTETHNIIQEKINECDKTKEILVNLKKNL